MLKRSLGVGSACPVPFISLEEVWLDQLRLFRAMSRFSSPTQ